MSLRFPLPAPPLDLYGGPRCNRGRWGCVIAQLPPPSARLSFTAPGKHSEKLHAIILFCPQAGKFKTLPAKTPTQIDSLNLCKNLQFKLREFFPHPRRKAVIVHKEVPTRNQGEVWPFKLIKAQKKLARFPTSSQIRGASARLHFHRAPEAGREFKHFFHLSLQTHTNTANKQAHTHAR